MAEQYIPNDVQRAMKSIADLIESPHMGPYLRKKLPSPDVVLLMQAREDDALWKLLSPSDQVKLDLILDLWNGSDNARVGVMFKYLTDKDLLVCLQSIAQGRSLLQDEPDIEA